MCSPAHPFNPFAIDSPAKQPTQLLLCWYRFKITKVLPREIRRTVNPSRKGLNLSTSSLNPALIRNGNLFGPTGKFIAAEYWTPVKPRKMSNPFPKVHPLCSNENPYLLSTCSSDTNSKPQRVCWDNIPVGRGSAGAIPPLRVRIDFPSQNFNLFFSCDPSPFPKRLGTGCVRDWIWHDTCHCPRLRTMQVAGTGSWKTTKTFCSVLCVETNELSSVWL